MLAAGCAASNDAATTAAPPNGGTPAPNRDQTGGLGKTKSSTGNGRQTQSQQGTGTGRSNTSSGEPGPGEIKQWASTASATTSYGQAAGDPWNATQATGPPDVDPACGDNGKAWASLGRDTIDTITLTYDEAVIPSEIRVFQTYNPSQVTMIEVKGPSGDSKVVYGGAPTKDDGCPVEGYLENLGVDFPVDTVLVTVDQSKLGLGWAELDAVSLTGFPSGSGRP